LVVTSSGIVFCDLPFEHFYFARLFKDEHSKIFTNMTTDNRPLETMAPEFTPENTNSFADYMRSFNLSDETAHPSTPVGYSTPNPSSVPSESQSSAVSNIFSASSSAHSTASSPSGSATPIKQLVQNSPETGLSESATPVNDPVAEMAALDPNQLTLRLYIHSSLWGKKAIPRWDGLPDALRIYFRDSWRQDNYTLEFCEAHTEFLYSVAVADEKWRSQRQRGY
jgi:hypothetical protein